MKFPNTGTRNAKVLNYLLTGHSLDLPKAIALFGHVRLSDAVFQLRKMGHNIQTGTVKVEGKGTEFAYYKLYKQPWKGTLPGTRVRVLKGTHRGQEGVVQAVHNGSSHQVAVCFASMPAADRLYFPYDYLETIYADA